MSARPGRPGDESLCSRLATLMIGLECASWAARRSSRVRLLLATTSMRESPTMAYGPRLAMSAGAWPAGADRCAGVPLGLRSGIAARGRAEPLAGLGLVAAGIATALERPRGSIAALSIAAGELAGAGWVGWEDGWRSRAASASWPRRSCCRSCSTWRWLCPPDASWTGVSPWASPTVPRGRTARARGRPRPFPRPGLLEQLHRQRVPRRPPRPRARRDAAARSGSGSPPAPGSCPRRSPRHGAWRSRPAPGARCSGPCSPRSPRPAARRRRTP